MMKETEFCVFCGATPTNIEHVWPKWIGRYLGRTKTRFLNRTSTGTDRMFDGFSLTDRAKVVCEKTCNGGWMKALEDEASPVLKRMFDEKLSIRLASGDAQLSIARWVLKTAMMVQYTQEQSVIPAPVYKEFFDRQRMPLGCAIFVARHQMGQMPNGSHSVGWELGGGTSATPRIPFHGQMYGVTLFIENLVMQVIGYRFDDEVAVELTVPFPAQFRPYVERLWPMGFGVDWPPARPSLDDQQLIAFAASVAEVDRGVTPRTPPEQV